MVLPVFQYFRPGGSKENGALATLLNPASAVHAIARVGKGLQARSKDRPAALLTLAVGTFPDSLQGLCDLLQYLSLVLDQAECKLPFLNVYSHIGRVGVSAALAIIRLIIQMGKVAVQT